MLYVFCFSPNCLRKWKELVPSMSLPSLSPFALLILNRIALWQQNKIWQRTDPGSAACGCLMPQVSHPLSLLYFFFILRFAPSLNFEVLRECASLLKGLALRLFEIVYVSYLLGFPLATAFPLFHISTIFEFHSFVFLVAPSTFTELRHALPPLKARRA